MLKSARTGLAVAFVFTSFAAGAGLVLNPRFVDDVGLGMALYILLPAIGGIGLGLAAGPALERLARFGSSEAPVRALDLLWASIAALFVFFVTLAFLPPFLGVFTNSETLRYGGGLLVATALAALTLLVIRSIARGIRPWIWPLLVALPVAAVVTGSDWGRGRGPGGRVLVLAVPGLSWNVAEDLIEHGEMPNLARLRASGAWGDVRGVRPPIPEVVWTSVATGKTADEHGIAGFSGNARDVRARRLWEILEERGWSVGLFGWPATWPPSEVNGFVVPAVSDVGTDTWPPELNFIREIAESEKTQRPRTWGRYCRYAFLGMRWGARLSSLTSAARELVEEPLRGRSLDASRLFTRRKLRARLNRDYFVELRRRQPADFAAFYTNIVHIAQSFFWKYHEPSAFAGVSPDDIRRYGASVHDAYTMVDAFLGTILADTEPNDLVVVVSDHGASAIVDSSPDRLTVRIAPMLRHMRLKGILEATNLGARTYLRMKEGNEGARERVRRLFETARLAGEESIRPFGARLDEWGNVVVTVDPVVASRLDDTVLFQGGRCPVAEVVRAVEIQESAQLVETGALVLNGRGITPGRRIENASLLDLVPTLLVLTGHDLAADLPGDVMHAALDEDLRRRVPGVVATYERPDAPSAKPLGRGLPGR